jgi:glucosyl-dolichyl phosphate glucuronosyltransferase
MFVSVAVCTYNRHQYLRLLLDSLLQQVYNVSEDHIEIIVVDNNSTDATRAVVEVAAAHAAVPIRYIHEPQQGVSYARNAAIGAARGDVIAFIDDDATADPCWVSEIIRVFEVTSATCVGGRIDLGWQAPRPVWVPDQLLSFLGYLDYGDEVRPLQGKQLPFGGNLAIRAAFLHGNSGFDVSLGRKGSKMLDAEEIELGSRIRRQGGEIWYSPGALVVHAVVPERLQPGYFLNYAYWRGRSATRVSLRRDGSTPTFLRFVKRVIKTPYNAICAGMAQLAGRPARAMYHRCELQINRGYAQEYLHLMLGRQSET